jgi:FkbM family methyltransferase
MPRVKQLLRAGLLRVLGRKSKPRTILSGLAAGCRICVSPAERLGYLLGTADRSLQRVIQRFVGNGDIVYDVGANLGYVSLVLAKRVGAQGQVIAFEPVPQTFALLKENVALNKLSNIKLLNVAAAERSGEALIRMTDNLAVSSMVWHRNDPMAKELSIKTRAIDDLVNAGEIAAPSFVKVDVEGAEGLVFRGMRETLARTRPVLFVECSDIGRETAWPLLDNLGYRCQSLTTGKYVDSFDDYRDVDFLWLPVK